MFKCKVLAFGIKGFGSRVVVSGHKFLTFKVLASSAVGGLSF